MMAGHLKILIVDDDAANIERIKRALEEQKCETLSARDGKQALEILIRETDPHGFPGIVISDMKMPVMDGLVLLDRVGEIDENLPVILVTAYGDVKTAVRAIKSGAFDFIERPFEADILRARTRRALEKRRLVLENRRLRSELANRHGMSARLIGNSSAIQKLRDDIANIADTDASVIIHGETGSGKEVVARCLHDFGARSNARFVAINCGALPEALIDSELFGHEPGAFTDAKQRRIGLIEHARGGTLFLDEIESMPMALQVKLLRMLQERKITRLGSNDEIDVDIRVVAATKTDLLDAAEQKEFRQDLYYRLNVAELRIPRLNDRREDIPLLFDFFARDLAARHQRNVPELSRQELQQLMAHDWRGNVRELRNVTERIVLGLGGTGDIAPALSPPGGSRQTLPDQMDAVELTFITSALSENHGNVQAAADALGIPRRTLSEKIRKHGIDRKEFT